VSKPAPKVEVKTKSAPKATAAIKAK